MKTPFPLDTPLPNVLLLRVRGKRFHREPRFIDKLLLLGRGFQGCWTHCRREDSGDHPDNRHPG